jgi:cysteine synthase A
LLFDSVVNSVGHTPLVRLQVPDGLHVELFAKLELQNLFGMKDRVARNIIAEARRTGVLQPGAPIVESSSGTMALGVALVGRSMGHPVHIVTDPRVDPITLAKLRALGCQVAIVPAMTSNGWQSARLERLAELMAELPGAFWPQQYSNPDNPAAYRSLAAELLADLNPLDVLVGSVGSGGSLCGTARALRQTLPELQVVGIDCVGSALFDQPDRPTRLQSGLGNSLLPKNLDRRLIDEVHWLNDREAFAAARQLAAEQQLFAGNTSGSVYRVMCEVARRAAPGDRIVGIFPDRGDRYTDTVFSDAHWQQHRLAELAERAEPVLVDYGTEVDAWSRARNEGARHTRQHLIFVESNTTGTGMLALAETAELGFRPVLLTNDPDRYPQLATLDCEVIECDSTSLTALRTVIADRFRREELAGVASTSEFAAPAVAELASWLGLPGNSRTAMETCRNKAALRNVLQAAGIRQPEFGILAEGFDPAEAETVAARVGLPCVVKPVDDSGSNAVLLCANLDEVVEHARSILAVRMNSRGLPTARAVLVERYLPGREYSVEMFGVAGEQVCLGITEKSVGDLPHFVELGHVFPAPLPAADAAQLESAVRAALAATGVDFGATHTELRLTADGPAVIEINPRLAGGMIPELIHRASGVNVLQQQLRAALGLPVQLQPSAHRVAGIGFLTADRSGDLLGLAGTAAAGRVPGVERVELTAKPGRPVRPARNAYDRLGYLIATGATAAEARSTLDQARAAITVQIAEAADRRPAPQPARAGGRGWS